MTAPFEARGIVEKGYAECNCVGVGVQEGKGARALDGDRWVGIASVLLLAKDHYTGLKV